MDKLQTVRTTDGMIWSEPIVDELLVGKDGEFELDALAMAVVNGNQKMIQLLVRCSLLISKTNPYGISKIPHSRGILIDSIPSMTSISQNDVIVNPREQLRRITRDVMESHPEYYREVIRNCYKTNVEYNFLPLDEYLFHLTFFGGNSYEVYEDELEKIRRDIFQRTNSISSSLQRFLCELQDGQGRTALHVAVDEGTVDAFLRLIPKDREASNLLDFLESVDGIGRTPLHRAAALSSPRSLGHLLGVDGINVNAPFMPWEYAEKVITDLGVNVNLVSRRNGFEGFESYQDFTTALGIAILHRKRENVKLLLHDRRNVGVVFSRVFLELQGDKASRLALGPLQLAALLGDASILELLLEDKSTCDPGRPFPILQAQCSRSIRRPAIHLAAAAGRFDMLTLMMGKQNYDPFVNDWDGNTALHHAVSGREFEFNTHLIDHINCQHACDSRQIKGRKNGSMGREAKLREEYIERQGCIELLLQFGFDVWRTNEAGKLPYPGSGSPSEFLSWWFNRWTKETIASQRTHNAAANAVSVTAILVATASYMGPFQPPLGYDRDTGNMEIRNSLADVYLFCQTMAFYLAVAAVMLGLMTFLPLPRESMLDELKRTRYRVIMAVGLLFPAIIFLLLDFATASILVAPQQHAAVPTSTVCLGGFFCLSLTFVFLIRLIRIIFYKDVRVRNFSGKIPFL